MIDLSLNEVRHLMSDPDNIRNISLIVDSKDHASDIIDNLIKHAGIRLIKGVDKTGGSETTSELQQIHSLDTKYVPVPLYAQLPHGDVDGTISKESSTDEYLINLMNCSDFVCLTPDGKCSAMYNTDGVIVVLDCMKGLSPQAERVFQQALSDSLTPLVFIDNFEQILLKSELSQEDVYQHLVKLVESVDTIVMQHHGSALGNFKLCPSEDNVIFGSTSHGWAFTVGQCAATSASKFDLTQTAFCNRFWGNWFYNSEVNEWFESGGGSQRGFNQFVLDPLRKIYNAYGSKEITDLSILTSEMKVTPSSMALDLSQTNLPETPKFKLPGLADAFTRSIIKCLPSPNAAQQYRVENLYLGSQEDEVYHLIRRCASGGDLMFRVSNVVPSQDKKLSYVIGRVFSGTIQAGMKVRIQGEDYVAGKKQDLYIKAIDTPVLLMGPIATSITDVPAGNIVCLTGVADYISKGGTITTSESAGNIGPLSREWNSTVYCSVEVVDAQHLPKLITGLKMLAKCDTNISFSVTEAGDHVMRGFSEHHLRIRFKELEDHYAGVPLTISQPYTGYRESVRQQSSMTALSKTPNKFSRFWVNAEPLSEEVSRAIEQGKIAPRQDSRTRTRTLVDDHGWKESEARRIWAFAPDDGANVVVDTTRSVQYINDVKDFFIMGFKWATKEGPLAEEPMRSVRLNIVDIGLFSDTIHRGAGQVIPTARRVTYAATLLADPVLMEPVYQVEVQAPAKSRDQVALELIKRRGNIISLHTEKGIFGLLSLVKAYLPVVESFGLNSVVYDGVGPFSTNLVFDHWQAIPGSPLDPSTMAGKIAVDVRTKKGLGQAVPDYSKFYDKL